MPIVYTQTRILCKSNDTWNTNERTIQLSISPYNYECNWYFDIQMRYLKSLFQFKDFLCRRFAYQYTIIFIYEFPYILSFHTLLTRNHFKCLQLLYLRFDNVIDIPSPIIRQNLQINAQLFAKSLSLKIIWKICKLQRITWHILNGINQIKRKENKFTEIMVLIKRFNGLFLSAL